MSSSNDPTVKHVGRNVAAKKKKRPQKVQNAGDYSRVMSQMRNQLCGRFSTVAIVVSRYEIIAKLLLPRWRI